MDKETFLENFGVIADAPNGIQQLRKSILRLAVAGLLVPQDSGDESVDFLLTSIAIEQKRSLREVNDSESILPKGWKSLFLSDFVCLEMGQSPDSNSYNDRGEGLPFYQGKSGFGSFTPTPSTWCTDPNKLAQPGDVLLSVRAPVGPTNYVTQLSCIGRGLSALRPLCGVETRFILWWMRAFEDQIAGLATGTTFVAVSKKILENFVLPVPPLAEQKRIVAKVDELMALCDELEAEKTRRETLRTAARASAIDAISTATTPEELSIAWSRISSNWETIAGSPGTIAALRLLINDLAISGAMQDELDSSRDPWPIVSVGEVSEVSYGYTESARMDAVGPKFLRITDIRENGVDWESVPYCLISKQEENKHLLQSGDLVFARTGATTGKSYLLVDPPRAVSASYLIRLRPDKSRVLPRFLSLYFHTGQYWNQVREGTSGTAQGGVNSSKLKEMVLPMPPLEVQEMIVARVDQLLALCDELEVQLENRTSLETAISHASSQLSAV